MGRGLNDNREPGCAQSLFALPFPVPGPPALARCDCQLTPGPDPTAPNPAAIALQILYFAALSVVEVLQCDFFLLALRNLISERLW